jgi:Domain of unknown function (DUF4340)
MNRTQQILIGLLVAQVALAVALLWPRPAPAGAGGAPLLGVKADEITSLAVRDSQGNSIKLAKSGAQWVMPDAGDYPADAAKIQPVLASLVGMKASRLVAQTPGAHRRLQVADDTFSRRIDLETPAGMKTVYLGTSGGAGSSHVRLGGQDPVYLVSGLADSGLSADAASWTNPGYFVVPQGEVLAMSLSNANGRWSFSKGADGQWALQGLAPGETLNTQSVQDLLNTASYVRLARPLGKTEDPAYGLAQPSAVVTLVTKAESGEKTYTLAIGAQDPTDKTYVVKSSESPYFVRVGEFGLKDLVEKTSEGFLTLPPTGVPAAGPATPAPAP